MRKIIFLFTFFAFFSCVERVPITNRKQVSLISEYDMINMSLTEYDTFLKTHKTLPEDDPRDQIVKRIGNKIKDGIVSYLNSHNQGKRVDGYVWEFHAVDEATVNAWCMPGGKVVVYTGLLPITRDEPSLAIVMGHEIGHAIARHGNERMSEQLIAQGVGTGLSLALSQKPAETRNLFLQAYNAGAGLELLSYSRHQESEADKLGLVFAAIAGYDPRVAIEFWKRMEQLSKGNDTPVFLRTHPSDEQRVKDIEDFMPQAMKYYAGK